jgi:Domain of unknown function (DUF1996)
VPGRGRTGGRTRSVRLLVFVLLGAVALTSALAATGRSHRPDAAPQFMPGSFPGGRYFNVTCGFSHRNNDDPIVFPGAPGRSHNHTFIGNRNVTASSTAESLVGGTSTCDEFDSSTYWVPTLFDALDPQLPLGAIVYYTRHTTGPVVAPPAGLKIVAGNQNARRAQPKHIVSFSCGVGGGKRFAAVVQCSEDSALAFNVRFPNCWNGTSKDSPNHKRHMAYSSAGACPESHPVRLPTIDVVLLYSPTTKNARPSSGKFGAHADFMNGWDQNQLERIVSGLNR